MQPSKRVQNIPEDIYERIFTLAKEGLTAAAIRQRLVLEFPEREEEIPPLRTLQRRIQEIVGPRRGRVRDTSGPWVPTEMPGQDAALVFEAIVPYRHVSTRGFRWPSRELAARIRWIRTMAPTLPPLVALPFAQEYLAYPNIKEAVDWVLAYRVWESPHNWDVYCEDRNNGKIPQAPRFLLLWLRSIGIEYLGIMDSA